MKVMNTPIPGNETIDSIEEKNKKVCTQGDTLVF